LVTRDLWAYQLANSHIPPPPGIESVEHSHDSSLDGTSFVAGTDEGSRQPRGYRDNIGLGTQPDLDSEDEDEDPGTGSDLLEQISDLDSLSNRSSSNGDEDEDQTSGRRKRGLRASDVVVTLIVALWIIRFPITGAAITRSVNLPCVRADISLI
jgi:RNA polymerase I-specific transcription initiation factor RRN7